jgi:hypothetical protein
MKKIIILLFTITALTSQAQTWVKDSVSMTSGYAEDVFYSMTNSTVKNVSNTNWQLAFSVGPRTASVRINGGRGVQVRLVPASIANFSTFDTTGWNTFPQVYDSPKNWDDGAFNSTHSSNPFDQGWGMYDQNTHHVVGDSVYIISTNSGITKKLTIDSLLYDSVYIFRYANLDNSDMKTVYLSKMDYKGQLFAYYSIATDAPVSREPNFKDWDILFTRFIDLVPGPGGLALYPVTGVLANKAIECVKADHVNVNTVSSTSYTFSKDANTIGSNWKVFDQGTNSYTVADSLAYFVRRPDGSIYKIVFTGFAGTSTGKISFDKTDKLNVGMNQINGESNSVQLFPNPSNELVNLVFNMQATDKYTLSVVDMSGKLVLQRNCNASAGIQQQLISTENLANGIYQIHIAGNNIKLAEKLIVNH